jgi:hypothetical protein
MQTITTEAMPQGEVEATLMAKLRLQGVKVKPRDAWRRTIGWAQKSPEHLAATQLGAEWRAKVNQQSIKELNGHP